MTLVNAPHHPLHRGPAVGLKLAMRLVALAALLLATFLLASKSRTNHTAEAPRNNSNTTIASDVSGDAAIFAPQTCNEDYHSPISYSKVLENLQRERIFFLGDSLLRYQYTSIAYYVTTRGLWRHSVPGEPPNEDANQFGKDARLRYFTESTRRLQYEVCDCYRGVPRSNRGYWQTTREARYYNNTRDSVVMYFVFQMGSRPLTLHTLEFLRASCAHATGCQQKGCAPGRCDAGRPFDLLPPVANEELWVREICRLKPTVVILNMGKWGKVEGPLAVPLLQRTRERVRVCLPQHHPLRLIWWRTTPTRDETMRYRDALRKRMREDAARGSMSSIRAPPNRLDQPSRVDELLDVGGRSRNERRSGSVEQQRQRHQYQHQWEQELWPQTDSEIVSNISAGPLAGQWELWDQSNFLRSLVRHSSSTQDGRDLLSTMSSVFVDNAHYTTSVVAALSRNMLLRLFGCAIRSDEPRGS